MYIFKLNLECNYNRKIDCMLEIQYDMEDWGLPLDFVAYDSISMIQANDTTTTIVLFNVLLSSGIEFTIERW